MQVNPKITFFVPDFENPIETSFISSEIKAGFPSPARRGPAPTRSAGTAWSAESRKAPPASAEGR